MSKPKRTAADALRDVPPREFVHARNALAARLAESGKTAEARRVGRLRRPSPVVWALNRAAAVRPRDLGALVDAVDRLRRAQLGRGDLRTATEGYRTAFEPLVRAANEALREAGSGGSAAIDRRIRSTLLAAVTDRGLRADLEDGRLSDEHADPGFAVVSRGPIPAEFLRDRPANRASAALKPASAPVSSDEPPAGVDQDRSKHKTDTAQRPARKAREAPRLAREQARATREAARRARVLERDANQAERAAQVADRRVGAMRRALETLEQRSAELRAAADKARKAVSAVPTD